MSSIPNYLALYNLSEINADIIIVGDLTATRGTIFTLDSTTGTITTLNSTTSNITTANITTLFTNLWRGTSPTSTMIMGDTITSGNIRIGNYTTPADQTGSIFLYGNTFITGSKSLFINNGDLSLVSSTGIITGNILRGVLVGDNISLYSTTTGTLTLGNTGGGNFTINPSVVLATGKNLTTSSTGKIITDIIESIAAADNIILYSTTTGTLTLGNTGGGNFTINPNVVLASGKNLTTSSTGKIITDIIEGIAAADNITLYSTTTGTLTLGNTGGGNFTINPSVVLPANKTITLNATGGKIKNNVYTGTATSSNIEIGESSDTGLIRTYKDLYIGTTPLASNKGIYCNYFDSLVVGDTINFAALQSTGNLNIQPSATSGSIVIGNATASSDSGTLTLNKNFLMGVGKTLIFSSTGLIKCDVLTTTSTSTNLVFGQAADTGLITPLRNIVMTTGSSGNKILCNYYNATSAGADLYIGDNQTSGSIILNNTYLATGKLINITSTGKLVNSTFESVSPTTAVSLFNDITGADITISNTANTGKINMNASVVLPASKTITLDGTGGIITCNSYRGTAISSAISLFSTTTAGITLGGASSGISLADNTTLATGKTLTLSTTGSVLSPTYNSTSATQALLIGNTNTTSSITIGGGQTSGAMFIGGGADTGSTLTCYKNINIDSNRSITLSTNGVVYSDYFSATTASSALQLGQSSTTGSITIGGLQTTGNVNLSTTSATGRVVARNKIEFRTASDSCYINTNSGANIFTASSLAGMYITNTTYAGAPTDNWSCWDSNATPAGPAPGDGSAIVQNGNTTMIINPGDNSTLWWLDEDNFAATTSWAWSGWKVSTLGVITNSSDRRIKRDITPITEGGNTLLDKLSLIQYVNFKLKAPTDDKYYKNGKLRQKYQDIHKGLIAQDVKEIFPDVVKRENANAYWTITHQDVDIYFNMGVQELIKRDKEKQVIIDNLTTRLARLEQILLNP
jgi:hypothetical protein